jgi:hypothetical protein
VTSAPKETTTKVEPWSAAKPYLKDVYAQFDQLLKDGAPQAYQGSTVAKQSQATKDSLAMGEQIARGGNTSALTNATNAVNGVMTSTGNGQAQSTLSQLQNQTSLGTNPTNAIASQIANGGPSTGQSWTNAAAGTAAGLQNYDNSAISKVSSMVGQSNPALAGAAGLQGYNNSAISNIQSMLGQNNPALAGAAGLQNYTNDATAQAANLGGYTNAASGLQQAQANQLANGSNPAASDYLKQTASGANIGNNPYLNANIAAQQSSIADQLKNVTNPGIDSNAAAIGRMGSGAYASQRNNADSTAAKAMSDVAVSALTSQFNTDVAAQQNAANLYGNLYNQDVSNQMNANQALSNTSNAQQSQRLAGTQLYGALNDSTQAARQSANQAYGSMANANQAQNLNAANSLAAANDSQQAARQSANQNYGSMANANQAQNLAAANSLGSMNDSQAGIRQNANANYADILNSQQSQQQSALQNDRNYQLSGMSQLGTNYQNSISNMLGLNDQRMNAANSQISADNALNGQKLNAAGMAGQAYQNQYLPSQMLGQVGQSKDAYADLLKQAEVNAWDRSQSQPLQNLANFTNILNGGGYSSTTTPVYTNTGAQVIGGLSSLAGLFALCDLREKILHAFVGYMPLTNGDRIGIYEFSYLDDETGERFFGPVAQEVEAKTGAVIEHNNRKHIDVAAFMKEAA